MNDQTQKKPQNHMSEEDEFNCLIDRLKNLINKREKAELTNEQVECYIGSSMSIETLRVWVDEAEDFSNPITAAEVIDVWKSQ